MGFFSRFKKKQDDNLNISNIDVARLPKHVAFIIDGNGRWAEKRGLLRTDGHKAGVEAVKNTLEAAKKLGIKICSFFVFSTENWNRPQDEVDALMDMLRDYVKNDTKKFVEEDVKLTTMGDLTRLPKDVQEAIEKAKKQTENCKTYVINICINYGGRADIVQAVNRLLKEKKKSVTEKEFANYLYSENLPEPDLIVRTSGELRISNFMLYQMAYSEFYFPEVFWPDFNEEQLIKAVLNFQKRKRRFGAIKK